jgi:hypothetical protein
MTKSSKQKNQEALAEKRIKYFMQMLNINRDTNMTRVYSVISSSNFFNTSKTINK